MLKEIDNCLRWRRFKKKILSNLPKYHPETGIRLDWLIFFTQSKIFDTQTGIWKQKGLATLKIEQLSPQSLLKDSNIYKFNYRIKKIEKRKFLRWC